jgi:hypothetical protein
MFSVPLLLLFYADKSFSGAHTTHHPIYSKWILHILHICKRTKIMQMIHIVHIYI